MKTQERKSYYGSDSNRQYNPVGVVARFYSRMYQREKSDSPDQSRVQLAKRIMPYMQQLGNDDYVLGLGSGTQLFEKQYLTTYTTNAKIVTLDIAEIERRRLLAIKYGVEHVVGDGSKLPFADNVFSFAVSNMALDFMPENAISELHRVLKPNAHALVGLHHPVLIPDDLEKLLEDPVIKQNVRDVLNFWKYLKDNNILFTNPNEIRNRFEKHGFIVKRVRETHDEHDKWWEVDLFNAKLWAREESNL